MIKTEKMSPLVCLIFIIGLVSLSYGGDSIGQERTIFYLKAEKGDNGIKTDFEIWANSKEEARENLSLNGWNVLSLSENSKDLTSAKSNKTDSK